MIKANTICKNEDFFFHIAGLEVGLFKRAFVSAIEQSRLHLGFPYTFRQGLLLKDFY